MEMIMKRFTLLVTFFIAINTVDCLRLESLTTSKPRITKYTSTSNSLQSGSLQVGTTTAAPTSSLYRLYDTSGHTCILFKMDGIVSVFYVTKSGEEEEVAVYIPDKAIITGDCRETDLAELNLAWPGFSLNFRFEKTPGGERWFVDKIKFTFDSDHHSFEHIIDTKHEKYLTLSTSQSRSAMLFPTPVGKSFQCLRETKVKLTAVDEHAARFRAVLFLRDFRIQPFMYKNNDFGAAFKCSRLGYIRDETAPFIVGTILFLSVLGTVGGYAVWRYVKVKKVQYATME